MSTTRVERPAAGAAGRGVPGAHRSGDDRPLAVPRRHDQRRRAAGGRRVPGHADVRGPGRAGQDDRAQRHLPGPVHPAGARTSSSWRSTVRDRRPAARRRDDDHPHAAGRATAAPSCGPSTRACPDAVAPADNELGWRMALGRLAALVESLIRSGEADGDARGSRRPARRRRTPAPPGRPRPPTCSRRSARRAAGRSGRGASRTGPAPARRPPAPATTSPAGIGSRWTGRVFVQAEASRSTSTSPSRCGAAAAVDRPPPRPRRSSSTVERGPSTVSEPTRTSRVRQRSSRAMSYRTA